MSPLSGRALDGLAIAWAGLTLVVTGLTERLKPLAGGAGGGALLDERSPLPGEALAQRLVPARIGLERATLLERLAATHVSAPPPGAGP